MIELPLAITEQQVIAVAPGWNERSFPELAAGRCVGGLAMLEVTVA